MQLQQPIASSTRLDEFSPFGYSSPFAGAFDAYATDLQVALLPFRGFTSYLGEWLNLRESGGNTLADIGYLANGEPNTAAWSAHVGAGSGFTAGWYSQDGSARNCVQATDANQPESVLNIVNGYPVCRLDGVDDLIQSVVDASTTRSLYLVTRKVDAQTGAGLVYAGGLSTTGAFQADNGGSPALGGGWGYRGSGITTSLAVGGTVTNWSMCTAVISSAAVGSVWIDNAAPTNFDPINAVTTTTDFRLGNLLVAGSPVEVVAALLYNAAHDDATREAIQTILAAKFGITLSP